MQTTIRVLTALLLVTSAGCRKESKVRTAFSKADKDYAKSLGTFLITEDAFGPFTPYEVVTEAKVREVFTNGEVITIWDSQIMIQLPSSAKLVLDLKLDGKGRLVAASCLSLACQSAKGLGVGSEYAQLRKASPKASCVFAGFGTPVVDSDVDKALCQPTVASKIRFEIAVDSDLPKYAEEDLKGRNVGAMYWFVDDVAVGRGPNFDYRTLHPPADAPL
ncbi:MAG: hypothetical protein GY811_21040 [Myxococcales bacterium]|nr:hypothetical protein [Myxococcales bacterium]